MRGKRRNWYREVYLQSGHWRRFRAWALAAAGYRCQDCGAGPPLDVHHLHYRTLWHEAACDVRVVCRGCHDRRERLRRVFGWAWWAARRSLLLGALALAGVACAVALADSPPSTPPAVSDDFNRANGGLGSNWTAAAEGVPQVVSNAASSSGTVPESALYTGGGTQADQIVEVKVSAYDGSAVQLFVRSLAGTGGYLAYYSSVNGWRFYTWNGASTFTQMPNVYTTSATVTAGSCVAVVAIGKSLSAWVQSGCTGAWGIGEFVSDSTYTAAGYGGIRVTSTAISYDDYRVAAYAEGGATTVTATLTAYTGQATVTNSVYTSPSTVTSAGGTYAMGPACGNTTQTDPSTGHLEPPCMIDAGTSSNVLELLGWGVGVLLVLVVVGVVLRGLPRSPSP